MRSLLLAPLLTAFVSGCLAESPDLELEDDDALVLVAAVEAEGYRDWDPPPTSADLPRRRVAAGPHGAWVEVYLHPQLLEAFFGDTLIDAWPPGVAAVCESYESEEADVPFLVNVMRKQDEDVWSW